jgi:hypothetical protein
MQVNIDVDVDVDVGWSVGFVVVVSDLRVHTVATVLLSVTELLFSYDL